MSRAVEAQQAAAQQWATISGKFVVDGKVADIPQPKKINVNKDEDKLKGEIFWQDVVVSPKQELANVFVWVRSSVQQIHLIIKLKQSNQ